MMTSSGSAARVVTRAAGIAMAAIACSACTSMFIHGGRLVGGRQSIASETAVYQIARCTDASGAPGQQPDATYHVLPGDTGPELLERSPDGSGVLISNRWEDDAGVHFFAWGAGLGWEYTLPSDGSPARRLGHRRPGSTEASDGTRRPLVSAPPESDCTLTLVSGTPPGTRRPTRPALAPMAVASTPAIPREQRADPVTEQPFVFGPEPAPTSTCAAGRVETADGHCCPPGDAWDPATRQCATPTARCAEGRVATTDGYCCWPGQSFDTRTRTCSGPPRCPAGLGAAGDDCVATR